jgi:hypothetical protein
MRQSNANLGSARIALAAAALFALQACAVNPLVKWDPPARKTDQPRVLDDAYAYSASARQAYAEKMYDQVGMTAELSSGLIALGALVTALAVFKVHRDPIIGGALLGATAFTLGTWNLDKRRLTIHQAAIAAFNCADLAIAPLNMTRDDLKTLQTNLTALERALATTNLEIGKTERELNDWIATGPAGAGDAAGPFRATIIAAQNAVEAATQTKKAGDSLVTEVDHADEGLRNTVQKIHLQASGALADTQGDLRQLPTVIGSIASIAGSFVPGSNVGQFIADAQKAVGQQQAARQAVPPPPALQKAVADLNDSVRQLMQAEAAVSGRVTAVTKSVQPKALEQCGVLDVSLAMTIEPSKVSVMAGAESTRTVIIKGGKPPFAVKPNGTPVTGVTITGPDRLGSTFEVKVSADIKTQQKADFLILDSSDPVKTVLFSVEINTVAPSPPPPPPSPNPAPAPNPNLGTPPAPSPKTATSSGKTITAPPVTAPAPVAVIPAAVVAGLKQVKEVKMGEVLLQVVGDPTPSKKPLGRYVLKVSCKPKPPQCLKQDDVRNALGAALQGEAKAATDKFMFVSYPTPGSGCVCKP